MKSIRTAKCTYVVTVATAFITLALSAAAVAQTAGKAPQVASEGDELQEVIVTGTNIRGIAAIGSDVMSVDREMIDKTGAQTVQQIMRTLPALSSVGATPQGLNPGNTYFSPVVHSLGASSSNSTLVLIDGHRIAPGNQGALVDPNIIPPIALERVEVLAEGASSIYGSDALAGVVNFITRRNFDGFEATAQSGFGNSYRNYAAGALWGKKWDGGSVLLAYDFSKRGAIAYADRSYLNRDHTAQGGTNNGDFFCGPASIQPGGAGNIYLPNAYTTSVANTTANSPCEKNANGQLVPQDQRDNYMAKLTQQINDKLTLGVDLVFSRYSNSQQTSRGTVTATVFRTGTQANPFYVNPAGVLPGTTAGDKQTIRFNADDLLGGTGVNTNNTQDYYLATNLEYKPGDNFRITAFALAGANTTWLGTANQLCVSCAYLGLNGTTNGSGSLTAVSIPGTSTIITALPLTAANALDVWNPAATNRTSPSVLAQLSDSGSIIIGRYALKQYKLGADGSLFKLPGGDVRIAFGGEFAYYSMDYKRTRSNNTGPATKGSEFFGIFLERNVESAYTELLIPIVGPDNAKRFIKRIDLSLSGRYDFYSNIGSTTNPRIALGWEVTDGLKLRGSYSRSFVAPQLVSVGDLSRGGLSSLSNVVSSNTALTVARADFPLAASVPGVTCTATTCSIPSSVNGISVNGSAVDPQPGKGISWSFGADFKPSFMPGFTASVTFFNNKLINQISTLTPAQIISTASLNSNLQFYPTGATQAQLNAAILSAPLQTAIPSPVYYSITRRSRNVLNLSIQGIDANFNWRFPVGTLGTFNVGSAVTYFTKFDQYIKDNPVFSVLNTTGYNIAFPSIQTQARANVGWEKGAFGATAFASYVGSYYNWSATTLNPVITANGVPVGGGDKVASNTLIDLNLTYSLQGGKYKGSQLFVDITNLFNKDPVFYNSPDGVDPFTGNVLGRVVTAGVRAKF